MKANELMIGDWVMFPYGIDKIVDLPYIEGKGLCASFAASATLFPVPVERLKPIPLTPEILEKNGFIYDPNSKEKDDGWWQWINFGIETYNEFVDIAFRDDDVAVYDLGITKGFSFMNLHLDYVHELQHALRLCGIEKEIVL